MRRQGTRTKSAITRASTVLGHARYFDTASGTQQNGYNENRSIPESSYMSSDVTNPDLSQLLHLNKEAQPPNPPVTASNHPVSLVSTPALSTGLQTPIAITHTVARGSQVAQQPYPSTNQLVISTQHHSEQTDRSDSSVGPINPANVFSEAEPVRTTTGLGHVERSMYAAHRRHAQAPIVSQSACDSSSMTRSGMSQLLSELAANPLQNLQMPVAIQPNSHQSTPSLPSNTSQNPLASALGRDLPQAAPLESRELTVPIQSSYQHPARAISAVGQRNPDFDLRYAQPIRASTVLGNARSSGTAWGRQVDGLGSLAPNPHPSNEQISRLLGLIAGNGLPNPLQAPSNQSDALQSIHHQQNSLIHSMLPAYAAAHNQAAHMMTAGQGAYVGMANFLNPIPGIPATLTSQWNPWLMSHAQHGMSNTPSTPYSQSNRQNPSVSHPFDPFA
ncbi:hypothetical protein L596_006636 [Steinernema carpocapsae]|uniref:Uncharacterized protein n=1 Tax=Steinernema carpocapsae TaxID=34508 RepID=A0A4U8VA23_STECR|nr:hypothetical protein L596_006636 [Steinernema carpocapsae]